VTIRAVDGVKAPAVRVRADSELHRVSITAPATAATSAVQVSDANAVLDRVFIHDANAIGLRAQSASVRARDVRIERVRAIGAWFVGAKLDADRFVVRDVEQDDAELGRGIEVVSNGALTLRNGVVSNVHDVGVLVAGADADVAATVVRTIRGSLRWRVGHAVEATVDGTGKPANVVLDGVVLDGAHDGALFVSGSRVTASRVTIRNSRSLSDAPDDQGRGVAVRARGELSLRASRIEGSDDLGVIANGATATLEEVLILATGRAKGTSRGVAARMSDVDKSPATVSLKRVLIAGSDGAGVVASGSSLTIEASEIRDVRPLGKGEGFCVVAQRLADNGPTSLIVLGSNLGPCAGAGVVVYGATGVVRGSLVHEISPRALAPAFGHGVEVGFAEGSAVPGDLTLEQSVITGSTEVGVLISGSRARIIDTTIRDTRPASADAVYAAGVVAQLAGIPAALELKTSLVDGARAVGVYAIGSDATLERTLIRDVRAAPGGVFGDGASAQGGKLDLRATLVRDVDRAGVSVFGSELRLASSRLSCVRIDLDSEPFGDKAATLIDSGGNVCGCAAPAACRAQSANLQPVPLLAR